MHIARKGGPFRTLNYARNGSKATHLQARRARSHHNEYVHIFEPTPHTHTHTNHIDTKAGAVSSLACQPPFNSASQHISKQLPKLQYKQAHTSRGVAPSCHSEFLARVCVCLCVMSSEVVVARRSSLVRLSMCRHRRRCCVANVSHNPNASRSPPASPTRTTFRTPMCRQWADDYVTHRNYSLSAHRRRNEGFGEAI